MIEITERPGSAEIRVETQEGIMLSAIPAIRLTAGLQGPSGPAGSTGAQGPQGVPGPNLVNTSTPTTITGILKGASGFVAAATAPTDYIANSDARLTDARTPTSHVHGNVSNAGAIGTTSGLPIKTGTAGVLEVGAFGSSAGQFVEGNDPRLSDARPPAAHTHADDTLGPLNKLTFDVTPTATLVNPGEVIWNLDEETLDLQLDGFTVHTNQHLIYHVQNQSGVVIPKGAPIMFAGTDGGSGKLLIKLWDGIGPATLFMGLAGETFSLGHQGTVVAFGKLRDIRTDGQPYGQTWTAGNIIYASPTAGYLTNVKPSAPNAIVEVAAVIRAHQTTGIVFIRPNYFTGDIFGPSSATDNAIARFDATTGKLIQNSGITIADAASGTLAGSNSGDVTLAGTPTYLTLTGQVITRNQINLAAASAHVTGILPAANGGTGQTALSSVNANAFGSGAGTAAGYVLTANGSGGAAWNAAAAGSAITGTGFVYVRTGGSATPAIGNPALPFDSMQTVWGAGESNFAYDVGPGSWTLDAVYPATTGDIKTFFLRGAGPQSTISLTWRMEDNSTGDGYNTPSLRIFSDKSVKISLTILGGNSTSTDSQSGGRVGSYELYNCWIDTLTLTPGEGTLGAGPAAIGDIGIAEYTLIENGLMEAVTITRKAVIEAGIFYPIAAVADGTFGQITISSGGTYYSIIEHGVGLGNLVAATAKGQIIGRKTAGGGYYEVCTILDFTNVTEHYFRNTLFSSSTGGVSAVSPFAVSVAANEKVAIEIIGVKFTAASTQGMRIGFTGPSDATSVAFFLEAWISTTGTRVTAQGTAFNTSVLDDSGNTSNFPFRVTCIAQNGPTPGTIQFTAGSENSGLAMTINSGAFMRVHRIP